MDGDVTQTPADIVVFTESACILRAPDIDDEQVLFSTCCVLGSPRSSYWVQSCLWERREAIRSSRVLLLVDSEAVQEALVRGISSIDDVSDLADAELYIDRVPTDANPADGASRGRTNDLESSCAVWVEPDPPLTLLSHTKCRKQLMSWATNDSKAKDTQ